MSRSGTRILWPVRTFVFSRRGERSRRLCGRVRLNAGIHGEGIRLEGKLQLLGRHALGDEASEADLELANPGDQLVVFSLEPLDLALQPRGPPLDAFKVR